MHSFQGSFTCIVPPLIMHFFESGHSTNSLRLISAKLITATDDNIQMKQLPPTSTKSPTKSWYYMRFLKFTAENSCICLCYPKVLCQFLDLIKQVYFIRITHLSSITTYRGAFLGLAVD